jgi:hypothetical protein
MFPEQFEALIKAMATPWQEHVYWWSQVVLTAIAFGSALVGLIQLRGIRLSRVAAVHIARATFLLELDRRWDSETMTAARLFLTTIREAAAKEVAEKFPTQNDGVKERHIAELVYAKLNELHTTESPDYQKLLSICGFFETAGLMVKLGHVSTEEIMGLFRGPITVVDRCFRSHIQHRQNETGVPDGLFEHALYLCDQLPKSS